MRPYRLLHQSSGPCPMKICPLLFSLQVVFLRSQYMLKSLSDPSELESLPTCLPSTQISAGTAPLRLRRWRSLTRAPRRSIPTSALVVMPNAGHLINLEEPDAFNRHLADSFQSGRGRHLAKSAICGRWWRRSSADGERTATAGCRLSAFYVLRHCRVVYGCGP